MADSRRVAVFLPALVGGGTERVMLNLAEGLLHAGCEVDLVLAQAEGPLVSQIPSGVRVVTLNPLQLRGLRTFAAFPFLMRYLMRARPDAIVTGLIRANVVSVWACRLTRVPTKTILTVHQLLSCDFQNFERWYLRLMSSLARRTYPHADRIIAVARGTADDAALMLGIERNRISVVPNPVLAPQIKAKAEEPPKHEWLQPGQPPVIVSAGRLEHPKDLTTLIRSLAIVRQKANARLMILGEGPLRSELEQLVASLGLQEHVLLPGFEPNPYPFIARAAAFVLSSRSEALPTVLIEALYLGTPVVATDCPSGPREILQGGLYGRLVPVGDAEIMGNALLDILSRKSAPEPPEAWLPYTVESATEQYIRLMFPDAFSSQPGQVRQCATGAL